MCYPDEEKQVCSWKLASVFPTFHSKISSVNFRWLAAFSFITSADAVPSSVATMTTTLCAGAASAAPTKSTPVGSRETVFTFAACASHADASRRTSSWLSAAAILVAPLRILSRDKRKLILPLNKRRKLTRSKDCTRMKCSLVNSSLLL